MNIKSGRNRLVVPRSWMLGMLVAAAMQPIRAGAASAELRPEEFALQTMNFRSMPSEPQGAQVAAPETEEAYKCADAQNRACALVQAPDKDYEALYRRSKPGPIRFGPSHGAARWGIFTRGFLHAFWTGKVFFPPDGDKHPTPWLTNSVFFGQEAVTAEIRFDKSLVDGHPSIILDYAKSDNPLARGIRDEIREVPGEPGVYIGFAYQWFPIAGYRRWLPFTLDFNQGR